jgi:hypothetical protein
MAPGGAFGGEYIVVDLHDFKGISLHIMTRHTKFRFHEHFVQKIALGPIVDGTRYRFFLRGKYERANVDIDALDAPQNAAADPLGDTGEAPEGVDPNEMGTSTLGPLHRGMYGRDRRGQKYPVDQWGVRVTLKHLPGVLYRPEGITQEAWRVADTALRTTWANTFPRRVQGIEPVGETAKVARRRELEAKRSKQRAKRSANALTAMAGIGSLLGKTELSTTRLNPESTDEDDASVAFWDSEGEAPSASARLAEDLKQKRQMITRKDHKRAKARGRAGTITAGVGICASGGPSDLWFDG